MSFLETDFLLGHCCPMSSLLVLLKPHMEPWALSCSKTFPPEWGSGGTLQSGGSQHACYLPLTPETPLE